MAGAREQLLVKQKALTRARDALAAERRRMPWTAVEKAYEFDGPAGIARRNGTDVLTDGCLSSGAMAEADLPATKCCPVCPMQH
jgi:predicted dithiol-disulfide oxidoreductase (DUF899 family)